MQPKDWRRGELAHPDCGQASLPLREKSGEAYLKVIFIAIADFIKKLPAISVNGEVEMISNCPGAQKLRQPQPEAVQCPSCSGEVEIWTDELQATCPNCQKVVRRQEVPNCLDWCRYVRVSEFQ